MKTKRRVIFGLAAAVVAALTIGAGLAYSQDQERLWQEKAHDQMVHALYDERKAELDEIAASVDANAEKTDLFAALDELDRFEEAVRAEEDGFKLHDGASYRHGELLDETNAHAKAFKGYVVEGYQKELDSLLIADVSAEGVTKEALAENAAALQALADEVGADAEERDVWASEDARAAFAAKVSEAVEADNARIAEIEEAERVEAERIAAEQGAAEEAAAAAAVQSYGGGYGNGYSGGGYSNSGGGSSGSSSSGGGSTTWTWEGESSPSLIYDSSGNIIYDAGGATGNVWDDIGWE